jgi:uncharacterized membrane protein
MEGGEMTCPKCGADNGENSDFCQKCGSPLRGESQAPAAPSVGLEQNVAGLLCYVLGWLTGIALLLVARENDFVRFHAAQSIVTFGAVTVVLIVLGFMGLVPYIGILFRILEWAGALLSLVLWVVLMIKAYQGEFYRVPFAADFAERHIGRPGQG